MRRNRVISALQALGGTGTTQAITRITRARPECISAQLSGMERRGTVRKAGTVMVSAKRWNAAYAKVRASIWRLA